MLARHAAARLPHRDLVVGGAQRVGVAHRHLLLAGAQLGIVLLGEDALGDEGLDHLASSPAPAESMPMLEKHGLRSRGT